MRSTARRYLVLLLVAVTLLLTAHPTSSSERPIPLLTVAQPFLAASRAQMQGRRALNAMVPELSLIPSAPSGQPVSKSTQAGGAAAPVTPSATVAAVVREAQTLPVSTIAVVREGQTLWMIAQAYDVSVDTLAKANGLQDAELIRPGQRLVIPSAAADSRPATSRSTPRKSASTGRRIMVVVEKDQTLWEIAQAYKVSVDNIVEANGLRGPDLIRPGQRLIILGVTAATPPRLVRSAPSSPVEASIVRGFQWPTRGTLTSRFGWRYRRHHDGIDIAASWGSPIYAAKAGRVIFSGWYFGYGRTVILDHGDGLTTLYGHASKLIVRIGDDVRAGQDIARVGCTGRCFGAHVHFEIRVHGSPVNPLKYL